jgi:hypothetical protein
VQSNRVVENGQLLNGAWLGRRFEDLKVLVGGNIAKMLEQA